MFVYCSAHGQAQVPIRLPGMRLRPAPLAGPMSRLRRVEHARPGSGRSVEHLRRQAQSAGRRPGDPAGRPRNSGGASRAAAERPCRVRPRDRRRHRRRLGDAGRRRSRNRQVDAAAPGRGAARERGAQGRLCLGRGIGRAGAASRGPARAGRRAGAARRRDFRPRHPDDRRRRRAARAARHRFDPDHAFAT